MAEINLRIFLLTLLLATGCSAATGGVFINELNAASDEEIGAMCGPFLRKTSGVFDIPLRRKIYPPQSEERYRLASDLFQVLYRTVALEKFGERTAPTAVTRAWNTTADDKDLGDPKTRHRVMNQCLAVYGKLRDSGQITYADEKVALAQAKKEVQAILDLK